jgi:hypothetical protein
MYLCVITSFLRANRGHCFADSIAAVAPEILEPLVGFDDMRFYDVKTERWQRRTAAGPAITIRENRLTDLRSEYPAALFSKLAQSKFVNAHVLQLKRKW